MEERALTDRAPGPAARPASPRPAPPDLEEAREHYLRHLLERFEAGGLEPYEYTRRVQALEAAASVTHMAEIVDAPLPDEPKLDAVDMLLLSRAAGAQAPGKRRPRYWSMVVMAFFFIILLIVGVWLVAHAKSLRNSGGLGTASLAVLSVANHGGPPA